MVNYFPYQNYTTICEQLIEKQKLVKKTKKPNNYYMRSIYNVVKSSIRFKRMKMSSKIIPRLERDSVRNSVVSNKES